MRHPTRASFRRPGTILPLLALVLIGLLTLVALAIDIGIIALARNHSQNAADSAAVSGVRMLNGDVAANNNYSQVGPVAKATAAANSIVSKPISESMVTSEIGYYAYNSSLQRFEPNFSGSKPLGENWTAVRVNINATQSTFFARLLGAVTVPVSSTATAVHRPRDIAIILDFSGSMQFSSEAAWPSSGNISGSLNPDPAFPKFGHWSAMSSVMQRTTPYIDSGGEVHAPNNLTMETENGPPIVRDFLTVSNIDGSFINAFHRPMDEYDPLVWACPAPSDWDVQSDATVPYGGSNGKGGDKWPLKNKASSGTDYAATVKEYLNFSGGSATATNTPKSTVTGPGGGAFDPVNPSSPLLTEGYGPNFKGYSMGPGYYGKTFYIWPPDPRYHPSDPALQLDWRKKFFYKNGTTTPVDDNSVLWDSSGYWKQANQSGSYRINYNAVLAWIKSGPKVLPDNLRAGRILYYSSIPDTIPSTGGTEDQRFWRDYIDYVLGAGSSSVQSQTLYGRHSSGWGTVRITAKSNVRGADNTANNSDDPYMNYWDNPIRPRLHFWFGPLTMLTFLAQNNSSSYSRNWLPGTCHEAQCWQLKAGINSALNDIQKNHPNDWVALIYFSDLSEYGTARVPLGRDYEKLKNALFFPFNILDNLSNPSVEIRPYNSSFSSTASGNVPNALGGTCPEMGFKVAYNQFSSRSGFNGRRGATKMVIFETDGVPNTTTNGSNANSTWVAGSPKAYNSWYNPISSGSYLGNNHSTVISRAKTVVQTLAGLDTLSTPGYSTPKSLVRIHSLAFGDLFQSNSPRKDDALSFLLEVQKLGNTSKPSATSIEPYKIIVGDYNTRIENLRTAFERIMQSGIQVTLIR